MKFSYTGFMRELAEKHPVTIGPEASFFEARRIIHERGIHHLPVVDKNNQVVGIVTDSDIRLVAPSNATTLSVHELNYLLGRLKVSGFMTPKKKLITITPDTLVEEAVQLMHDNKIGCLPIIEGKKLFGIFTETDALEIIVDIFGLKEKGSRLAISLEDKPKALLGIFELFNKNNAGIISFVLVPYMVEGKRLAVVNTKKKDNKSLIKDLEKAGYIVMSKDRRSSAR